jgi:hypothetical protein
MQVDCRKTSRDLGATSVEPGHKDECGARCGAAHLEGIAGIGLARRRLAEVKRATRGAEGDDKHAVNIGPRIEGGRRQGIDRQRATIPADGGKPVPAACQLPAPSTLLDTPAL